MSQGNESPRLVLEQEVAADYSGRVKFTVVKHCVPAGCSNTCSNNVSLYKFPRDPVLR